ncbi:EAL and HDOD domain-containing protein [Candidatus Thalassolituus haligoni]|uniref:EAL and HDOD domain-containing protein n=1 Tax=Candidatus Thalassolituus haligoni TaxID=3100113 RepID=UPI0035129C10|tara:strand:+ start:10567 stop:11796 length:1230 start_codon:yes stop_codon:yes gene_type:complete
MSEVTVPLLARQPILDQQQNIVGYELLSRPIPNATTAWQDAYGDQATSEVIMGAYNEIGIDRVTGGLPAFINFTRYWLENPPSLSPGTVVAELLEHLDLDEALIHHVKQLHRLKYQVALDDYRGTPIPLELLDYLHIIKIDVLDLPVDTNLKTLIQRYHRPGLRWLAEKVETREMFDACLEAGCELFQGYFFSKPLIMYGRRIPDNKLSVLKLLKVLNNPEVEVDDIHRVLQADPQLSFKMLQMVNSAYLGCTTEVTSINRAIVILGFDRIRAWSNLLALGRLNDKPNALQEQAVIRACLARRLAGHWPGIDQETAFTLGLFSLLDAFVDIPLKHLCEKLNLSDSLKNALMRRAGGLGQLLTLVQKLEQAEWDDLDWYALEQIGLQADVISSAYVDALNDARELVEALA